MASISLWVVLVACVAVTLGILGGALSLRVRRPGWRRAALGAVAVMTLPTLIVVGAAVTHVAHDFNLARFSRQLFEYPLPPDSSVVGRRASIGVLTGSGNHCDFAARFDLETRLPIEAVRAHYAGLQPRPAISGGTGGGPPLLEVQPREHGGFIVTILDAPYAGGLDLRCH